MTLSKEDKKAIREAAVMIYASAECDEMYNKEQFFTILKRMIAHTPIVNGYAEASRTLENLK